MAMGKFCNFSYERHILIHWKFVLKYCANFRSLVIPGIESTIDIEKAS